MQYCPKKVFLWYKLLRNWSRWWAVVSALKPRVEIVLRQSWKLCLNLWSRRGRKRKRDLVLNFSPLRLRQWTFFMPMLPAYRNQSIDLQCTSIDWFLYEGNIGMKKVKERICFWSNELYNFIFEDITAFRASNIRIKHIPFF